eukprot:403354969
MKMMKEKIKTLIFLLGIQAFSQVLADQPVHCLREQILGKWEFFITNDAQKVDILNSDTVCTHKLPNRLQIVKEGAQFSFPDSTYTKYEANLKDQDHEAELKVNGQVIKATWSMLYDQGLIIETDKNRLFTNFKYTLHNDIIDLSAISSLQVSSYDSFNSECDQTMIGVVQDKYNPGQLKCFYGHKLEQSDSPTTEEVKKDIKNQIVFVEDAVMRSPRKSAHTMSQIRYEETSIVNFINNNNFTWKASLHNRFHGLTLGQIKLKNYNPNSASKILTQTNSYSSDESQDQDDKILENKDFLKALNKSRQYFDLKLDDIKESDLPQTWDWRDVDGYDFTGPTRDQKGCGSCYTMSFLTSMESRIKIMTGKTRKLSMQFMIDCNFYTEGCDGGWPLLNGFFAQDFSIPLESCSPYKAYTFGNKCSDHKECQGVVKVEKAGYIGGSYGSSNELMMMKELRARGPIVSDLNVPLSFSYYTSGIFSDDHEEQLERQDFQLQLENNGVDDISERTLRDYHIEWQYINHSILIIGWGETNGVKFWICRNSYGPHWGEEGHFRVRRGLNDFGIESEPSSYIPKLLV